MKQLLGIFLTALLITFPVAVHAAGMSLTDAKHAGIVGEREDGLVAAVLPNPSADIAGLVVTTNSGRMEVYKQMAGEQNIPLADVRKIAAQKIFGMAAKGEYLMVGGRWVQK